jgi:hypothetical protein
MSVLIKLLSKFDDSGLRKDKSGFSGLSKTSDEAAMLTGSICMLPYAYLDNNKKGLY